MNSAIPTNEPESASLDDAVETELSVEGSAGEPDGSNSPISEPELPDVPPFPTRRVPTRRDRGKRTLLQTGEVTTDDFVPEQNVIVASDDSQDFDSEDFRSESLSQEGFLSSLIQPIEIREFNRIVPGGAERLLQLAEGEAQHRQEMERLQVEGQIALERAKFDHQSEAKMEVVRAHVSQIRGDNNARLATGCAAHAATVLWVCLAGYLSLTGQAEVAKAVIYAVAAVYICALLVGTFRKEPQPKKRPIQQWPPDIQSDEDDMEARV